MKIPRSRLSSLDIMILAMVKRGVTTSYALLTNVKMSVGATSQALKRLESERLLASIQGERSSQIYSITEKGEQELERQWKKLIGSIHPPIYESALRIIYMGWLFDEPEIIQEYASQAAQRLRYRASECELEAADIKARYSYLWNEVNKKTAEFSNPALVSVYSGIRCLGDAATYRAQASALENIALQIKALPQVKHLFWGGGDYQITINGLIP